MGALLFRERRVLSLVILMIVAMGALSMTAIGRQEDPTITNLFATVVTPFPGADPARVEALVTEVIEEELREIEEIDELTSVSRTGISVVQIALSEHIDDDAIERAWSEIRDALSEAALTFPAGVPEPDFDNDRTSGYTIISAIRAAPDRDADISLVRRYAELLQDRLRGLTGTKVVRLFGEPEEEVLVTLDPDRLADLGLTAQAVAAQIRDADAKVEAGRVRGDGDYVVEVVGEIDDLDRIRMIILRSGTGGEALRVGDIADVTRGIREPSPTLALVDGAPAVVVAARMEPDLQIDAWVARVRASYADFEAALPDGLDHVLLFDQADYTAERLSDLGVNMLIGVGLVVLVLLVTLGWRAALIVAMILPLTSLLALFVLEKLGVPIHQMSVTGLIVALGLLVDAAIVMTDEIRQRLERGISRHDAVAAATRRLVVPLAASTATTVLAFMPMALLPGPAGDFVGAIAISVIVMLTSSFLLALTVTPALAGMMLRPSGDRPRWWRNGIRPGALGRLYAASLDLALVQPRLAIMAALVVPVIGFGAFPTLTAQFFPGVDRDQFYVQIKLADGVSLARTEQAVAVADDILAGQDGITRVDWFLGESAPAFYYNMIADQDGVAAFAEALVTIRDAGAVEGLVPLLQTELDRALPEAQTIVRHLVQGPPVNAPVEIRLVGPNLETLRELGTALRQRIAEVPEVTHTRADLLGGAPKLMVDLDEEAVRLAGLSLVEVAGQLEGLSEGVLGGSLVEGSEQLPVRVRVGDRAREGADDIAAFHVLGGTVDPDTGWPGIPLLALGDVDLVPSDSPIARRDGERVNTVQAFLTLGVLPEEALKKVQALLADEPLDLPDGYRIEIGGDSDARAETVTNLMSSIGLIVALTVVVLVLTFNSFRLAAVAGMVSFLSMGLSLFALEVFAYPFGIQALIGVIGSIGVSINAAVIIMTALQNNADANAGDRRAMRDVVVASSRHIVSTTVTTFGGFLPLILGGGDFWPPFAMAIAGGVLLSTIVSFYFVPPMFLLVRGLGKSPRALPSPAS